MCFIGSKIMSFATIVRQIVVIDVVGTNVTNGIYDMLLWTSNHVVISSHELHIKLNFCSYTCHILALWLFGGF